MKKAILSSVIVSLLVAGIVNAGAIKTWATETLTASDLNTTFQHIHNNMVGGHGARLVNADVSSSAAISHSKLATPALLPKYVVFVTSDCAASPCTLAYNSGLTSITRSGAGSYVANFTARTDATYGVVVTAADSASRSCTNTAKTTTTASFVCTDMADVNTDTGFTFILWDNDN